MQLIDRVVQFRADIEALRRDLHRHPELAFEEHRTADLVARELESYGLPVHRGLAGTGVVATLRCGASARAIGLRADMDALPLQEANDFGHASAHPGRMHACGHDGHTAMLLAAAQHFAKHRNFDGTVYLIFQPAEEGCGGAREMIKDGLFKQFPMEAVFGMHNWPGLPAGALTPDYAGIRPKLSGPGEPAADFRIDGPATHGVDGLVNLFGIESPGLTASLAIGQTVAAMVDDAAG